MNRAAASPRNEQITYICAAGFHIGAEDGVSKVNAAWVRCCIFLQRAAAYGGGPEDATLDVDISQPAAPGISSQF
jgi:hypothetical protein